MKHTLSLFCCSALFACSVAARAGGWVLVDNKGNQTLGIIDPVAQTQIATVAEDGVTGHEVAASPDGKFAYVPIYGNAGVGKAGTDGRLIRVIDLAARKIAGTVDLGHPARPHCAVIGPKDGLLYVTTELDQAVTVIDPATLKVVGTIPTGQAESHMLAISSDGAHGYTANVGPGTVSVLDLKAKILLAIIPVCHITQRIALSVDDRWAFTSDQQQPRLAVIDTEKNKVARWIDLPAPGYGAAATPDGKWLLIAIPRARRVAAIDLKSMTVEHIIPVPRAPQEMLIQPDGAKAYVSCDVSKQVAEIDLKTWTVTKLINAGPTADGLAWANEP